MEANVRGLVRIGAAGKEQPDGVCEAALHGEQQRSSTLVVARVHVRAAREQFRTDLQVPALCCAVQGREPVHI